MLRLKLPELSDKELRDLEGSFDSVLECMEDQEGAAMVLERCASERDIAAALVRLASVAVREDVSGSTELRIAVGTRALMVAGNMLKSVARRDCGGATWAARATASALADALLKTQVLHAAARQAASVVAALGGSTSFPTLAAGAGPSSAACACAVKVAGVIAELVGVFCSYSYWRQDIALEQKLCSALRESCVLDQVGRLLLSVVPVPGAPAPSRELESRQDSALTSLCAAIHDVTVMERRAGDAGTTPPLPTGLPAAMILCAGTLSMADQLGCGLPRTALLMTPLSCRTGSHVFPCVEGILIQTLLTTLSRDQQLPRPTVPARAAIRLLLRVLRLASAAARASNGTSASRGSGRMVRVDMSWDKVRRVETQEYRLLIAPQTASQLVLQVKEATAQLGQAAAARPAAWAAEAAQAWGPLFGAVWSTAADMDHLQRSELLGTHTYLLETAVAPLVVPKGDPPRLVSSPAQLPPGLKAALDGGFVPLLETTLRSIFDHSDPNRPALALVRVFLAQPGARHHTALALVHAAPREAAALIATLSKLLLGLTPLFLTQGNDYMVETTIIMFACELLHLSLDALHNSAAYSEPPGPVDPAAPCAPLLVLSFAILQLLPQVSRLLQRALLRVQGEAGAAKGRPKSTSSMTASLQALLGAMHYAGATPTSLGTLPRHRLAVACSLPLLVDSGLERLLGALLALVQLFGAVPYDVPVDSVNQNIARCCTRLHQAYPVAGSASGAGGWQPGALRALATRLAAGTEPSLGAELEALAAKLEGGGGSGDAAPLESGASAAAAAALAERLAALKAEARALLPACANPACVNLAGDSEAGVKLQPCAGCKAVAYCCRECQAAHADAGHMVVCGGKGK
ncbi:hypothetical protein HYH03_012538 [Edaphochlamys debaryana]|uniref:phytol kinase n=1 Tax=Edaphochlamys debaryana TaxID=47281 RepID=A0A835XPW0_9CHLO|nr:hypothetical protein HYH03_012538 [Edaphochlamys debaryana]|eukprot:KAG2488912.1 hypothetical protein HYH03_012538 [Edaphochlamys debaryana]